jgi:GNAT superfamily N-acetyltransferase
VVSTVDEPGGLRIGLHTGSRASLRPLFELAEDSPAQLDSYLNSGQVLVARLNSEIVGHLQLVETRHPGEIELKNMAVREPHKRRGIGRALVSAAVDLLGGEQVSRLVVATAAADIDNLRFYQRTGSRLSHSDRTCVRPNGYPVEDPLYRTLAGGGGGAVAVGDVGR